MMMVTEMMTMTTTLLISGIALAAAVLVRFCYRGSMRVGGTALLLGAAMPLLLASCSEEEEEPCPVYEAFQESIAQKTKAVKALDKADVVLETVGLSQKIERSCKALQDDLTAYRAHLLRCPNEHCMAQAHTEVKKCDEVIRALQERRDIHSLIDLIRKIGLLIYGL